jgi:hypothetical protein
VAEKNFEVKGHHVSIDRQVGQSNGIPTREEALRDYIIEVDVSQIQMWLNGKANSESK